MRTCERCSCHSDDFCTKPQFYTPPPRVMLSGVKRSRNISWKGNDVNCRKYSAQQSIFSLSFRGNTVTVGISRERTIGCGCPTIMSLRGATTVATWQSSGANCAWRLDSSLRSEWHKGKCKYSTQTTTCHCERKRGNLPGGKRNNCPHNKNKKK